MSNRIFEHLLDVTEKSLNYRVQRQNVLAGNIANVDTPGYTPLDISFEDQLDQMLEIENGVNHSGGNNLVKTDSDHFPEIGDIDDQEGELFFDPVISPNNDKNSVDLDQEMSKLSINSILYNAQTTIMNKKLSLLKYAATDGNK